MLHYSNFNPVSPANPSGMGKHYLMGGMQWCAETTAAGAAVGSGGMWQHLPEATPDA